MVLDLVRQLLYREPQQFGETDLIEQEGAAHWLLQRGQQMILTKRKRDDENDDAVKSDTSPHLGSPNHTLSTSTDLNNLSASPDATSHADVKREHDSPAVASLSFTQNFNLADPPWLELLRDESKLKFTGSRAWWTVMVSRMLSSFVRFRDETISESAKDEDQSMETEASTLSKNHPPSTHESGLFSAVMQEVYLPWLLQNWTSRWDTAVRWAWEEWYLMKQSFCISTASNQSVCAILDASNVYGVAGEKQIVTNPSLDSFAPSSSNPPSIVTISIEILSQVVEKSFSDAALFRKFLFSLPPISDSLLLSIATLCTSASSSSHTEDSVINIDVAISNTSKFVNVEAATTLKVQQKISFALNLLFDIATMRPANRTACLQLLWKFCVIPDDYLRTESIRVVKRWWLADSPSLQLNSSAYLVSQLRSRAISYLDRLRYEYSDDATSINSVQHKVTVPNSTHTVSPTTENTTPIDQHAEGQGWSRERVMQCVDLYLVLCVREPALLLSLFNLYPLLYHTNENDVVQKSVSLATTNIIPFIGMPKSSNSAALTLLNDVLVVCPVGAESLLVQCVQSLSQVERPSHEFVTKIVELMDGHAGRFDEGLLWASLVHGEGLPKSLVYRGVELMVQNFLGLNDVSDAERGRRTVAASFFKLLTGSSLASGGSSLFAGSSALKASLTACISPSELLVSLIVIKDETSEQLKKFLKAIQLCFSHSSLFPLFPPRVLRVALQTIVDKYAIVPTLFLPTVHQCVVKHRDMVAFVVDTVLDRLLTKKIWIFDSDDKRSKNIWEGWLRCAKVWS